MRNPYLKNILAAVVVAVGGFALLNLTFLFNFLIFQLMDILSPADPESLPEWFIPFRHLVFLIIILLISWAISRIRLPTLVKAMLLTVPVAVVLVTIGILLFDWPVLPYLSGGLLTIGILWYFYRTKRSWLYYYSVILVALGLMVFALLGGEI